jgi:hypothetical protein
MFKLHKFGFSQLHRHQYLSFNPLVLVGIVGLDQMLEENRVEDLALFYQLLSRVHNGLKELNASFASYIKVCGCNSAAQLSRYLVIFTFTRSITLV